MQHRESGLPEDAAAENSRNRRKNGGKNTAPAQQKQKSGTEAAAENTDGGAGNQDRPEPVCAFCGGTADENPGTAFVSTPDGSVFVCERCLSALLNICDAGRVSAGIPSPEKAARIQPPRKKSTPVPPHLTPEHIKSKLDEWVIGQDRAKKILAVAAHGHCVRCANPGKEIEKTNVLLLGPSGSGKTFLVETLAKIIGVPFASVDITNFSETGYKGRDVSEILVSLIDAAGGDIAKAQNGIIFIDEIDKTANDGSDSGAFKARVQQNLLRMVEGSVETVPAAGPEDSQKRLIDTSNIMFIFAGAFASMQKVMKSENGIGFGAGAPVPDADLSCTGVGPEELRKYGMLPEFVGRIHRIAVLNPLTEDDLVKIMKESRKSACVQYTKLLGAEGTELVFADSAYRAIAHAAVQKKSGARGLRGIIEDTMDDYLYTIPSQPKKSRVRKLVITEAEVKDGKGNYVSEQAER